MPTVQDRRAMYYFCRSPFRSWIFVGATLMVAISVLTAWAIKRWPQIVIYPDAGYVSWMIATFPVGIWIYSLFLHWEIRLLVETADMHPSARLVKLHWGIVLGVASMATVGLLGFIR